MEVRQASNAKDVKLYTTERLREEFHIAGLFTADNVKMVYSHIDRIITAGFMPVCKARLDASFASGCKAQNQYAVGTGCRTGRRIRGRWGILFHCLRL